MQKNCAHILLFIVLVLSGCATLPTDFQQLESHAYSDTKDTNLAKLISRRTMTNPGESGFHLLSNGLDAFVARAMLIRSAEHSLDLQYYLYHNDLIGKLFTDLLLKAADRGVRVRLLVDDMGFDGRDLGAAILDSHPNMEVRIFNPFSRKTGRFSQYITRMGSVTRRMHNKSFTMDNQVAILGGRNIGNEYFGADPDLAFADLDVMAIGPVVNEISSAFDRYWNNNLAYPATILKGDPPTGKEIQQYRRQLDTFIFGQADSPYLKAVGNSELAMQLLGNKVLYDWGDGHVIYDQPEKIVHKTDDTQFHLFPQIIPYLDGVEKELIIFSPYFVPGQSGVAFLTHLVQRGVRVCILTNSLASNDVGIVHSGYAKYRKALLRGGIELYEMNKKLTRKERRERKKKKPKGTASKASLHAKSFVFDRKQVFIGSLNLDPRGVIQNTEIGVILDSKEIAGEMGMDFDQNIERTAFRLELVKNRNRNENILWHGQVDGDKKTFTVDPYTGFWQRLGINLMRILPIESQL